MDWNKKFKNTKNKKNKSIKNIKLWRKSMNKQKWLQTLICKNVPNFNNKIKDWETK